MGVRPDGGLLFQCFTHRWFSADSWTAVPQVVDTHHKHHRPMDPAVRRDFIDGAISVLLRAGAANDDLILQSTTPDQSMFFLLTPDGDGALLTAVNSRRHHCPVCVLRPLDVAHEQVLFDMGFGPAGDGKNYITESLPTTTAALRGAAETVFAEVYEEPDDFGLWALFRPPALAEAFYLAWSFRP